MSQTLRHFVGITDFAYFTLFLLSYGFRITTSVPSNLHIVTTRLQPVTKVFVNFCKFLASSAIRFSHQRWRRHTSVYHFCVRLNILYTSKKIRPLFELSYSLKLSGLEFKFRHLDEHHIFDSFLTPHFALFACVPSFRVAFSCVSHLTCVLIFRTVRVFRIFFY